MASFISLFFLAFVACFIGTVSTHGYNFPLPAFNRIPGQKVSDAVADFKAANLLQAFPTKQTPQPQPKPQPQKPQQQQQKQQQPAAAGAAGAQNAEGHNADTAIIIEILDCDNDDGSVNAQNSGTNNDIAQNVQYGVENHGNAGAGQAGGENQDDHFRAKGNGWQSYGRNPAGNSRRTPNNHGPCPISSVQLTDLYNELDHVLLENEWLRHQVSKYDVQGQPQKGGAKTGRTVLALQSLVVSFTATTGKDLTTLAANKTVVFDQVVNNTGGAYNETTGTFTCPATGIYIFSATIVSNVSSVIQTVITAGGVELNRLYSGSHGKRGSGSGTAIVSLKKGTPVTVNVIKGNFVYGKFSSFSGALLEAFD